MVRLSDISPWQLMRDGRSTEEIVELQRDLLHHGSTMWDYWSWEYLFGAPRTAPPKSAPTLAPAPAPVKEEPYSMKRTSLGKLCGCTDEQAFSVVHLLSMKQAEAIELFYKDGLTLKEVAQQTGTDKSNVISTLANARNRIKNLVAKECSI